MVQIVQAWASVDHYIKELLYVSLVASKACEELTDDGLRFVGWMVGWWSEARRSVASEIDYIDQRIHRMRKGRRQDEDGGGRSREGHGRRGGRAGQCRRDGRSGQYGRGARSGQY